MKGEANLAHPVKSVNEILNSIKESGSTTEPYTSSGSGLGLT